jgi:hypothetical protein
MSGDFLSLSLFLLHLAKNTNKMRRNTAVFLDHEATLREEITCKVWQNRKTGGVLSPWHQSYF